MGNVQDTNNSSEINDQNGVTTPPERPPRPNRPMYPNLNDGGDHDYEILRPGYTPSRPAPPTPSGNVALQHQMSTHTLSSGHYGLEGVPFVLNPKLFGQNGSDKVGEF